MINIEKTESDILLNNIFRLIDNARGSVAQTVNYEITLMYWNIGDCINKNMLEDGRASYGKQIIVTVAKQLQERYGNRGYDVKSIRRMMQFAKLFPDIEIVATAARQLSWSHFVEILPIKDELQREFYLTMASCERWSKRVLRNKIDGMLYERTLLSAKSDEIIKRELSVVRNNNGISPDLVFKNPYFLDFTGLKCYYSEKSLEDVLIMEVEKFILELGNGFTFMERQKRMVIDGEDFYLDLLFYHRKLRRLIAIELLCCVIIYVGI